MPRLTWDSTGAKRYENGVSCGVVYPQDSNGSYSDGAAWNGLTAVKQSPDGGDATPLYANNRKYLTLRSNENFKFTIEAYTYPDEFEPCNGAAELATGVTVGQQTRAPFGFTYRTEESDDVSSGHYKIHVVYGATASPSEKEFQSINDDPEAITMSWECETVPVDIPGFKPAAHIEISSRKADSAKMTLLENKLYGTNAAQGETGTGTPPTLPDPAWIISNFTAQGTP